MRILLVSFVEDNRWSGMGKWAHCVAEGLGQLGHNPTVWFADDFVVAKKSGRVSVLVFPVMLAFRLCRLRHQFDAIVIHEPSGLWYGILRRFFASLPPMVVMCHNVESKCFAELRQAASRGHANVSLGMRIKTPLFRLWQSDGTIKMADHVICLSAIDRNYLTNRLRCKPDQVTHQMNGVAAENYLRRSERSPEQRVLFLGGWLDIKGRRLLPSIWSQVHLKFPDARLTMIGTGQPAETVLKYFDPLDRMSVTVISHLTDEAEMTLQYAGHDLFLMPSLSEGCPLSLLEAMAASLPVVAARVGGIADVITHGVDGLLYDPVDPSEAAAQVCYLIADSAAALRIGRAGQGRARALTWVAASQAMESAIKLTMTQTRSRRA